MRLIECSDPANGVEDAGHRVVRVQVQRQRREVMQLQRAGITQHNLDTGGQIRLEAMGAKASTSYKTSYGADR